MIPLSQDAELRTFTTEFFEITKHWKPSGCPSKQLTTFLSTYTVVYYAAIMKNEEWRKHACTDSRSGNDLPLNENIKLLRSPGETE